MNTSDMIATANAAAAVATAIIAAYAATTWRTGLWEQRKDDCISAAYGCLGAVGRAVSWRLSKSADVWSAQRETWDSWRNFRRAFAVATRYKTCRQDARILQEGRSILDQLTEFCKGSEAADKTKGEKIEISFGEFCRLVEKRFR